MYIKMNDNKTLLITVPTAIYCGENKADMLTFLLPQFYGEMNMADYEVNAGFKLPDGSEHSEKLSVSPEMYKTYYMYALPIDTKLTSQEGIVTAWLTLTYNEVAQCTGEVNITVLPSRKVPETPGDNNGCNCTGNNSVYVPHIDDKKILSWTVETNTDSIPEPVDLNPFDEWSDIDKEKVSFDYIWEDM